MAAGPQKDGIGLTHNTRASLLILSTACLSLLCSWLLPPAAWSALWCGEGKRSWPPALAKHSQEMCREMPPDPPLLVPQPLLGDLLGTEQKSVNPSWSSNQCVLLCPEVDCLLLYTHLCSAFKKNLSFCSGLRFKEEKGCPWKLAVTFARLCCKSLLPPLFSPYFISCACQSL